MTDIARPAQTGQCRSVPPSSADFKDYRGSALFSFAQFSKTPPDTIHVHVRDSRLVVMQHG
jgi:hypothetical protein